MRGWLDDQLMHPAGIPPVFDGLPGLTERLDAIAVHRGPQDEASVMKRHQQRVMMNARIAPLRIQAAVQSAVPFQERLVRFWFDHFTVSIRAGGLPGLVDLYENEAIRPHVVGRFRDMLGAVVRHPLMLVYLDNALSIGPNSPMGRKLGRDINENFARELLELHTIGVDGGYQPRDIRELAKVLSGWTVTPITADEPYRFRFADDRHEPGPKQVLGLTLDAEGQAEGEKILDFLAASPKTARHLAYKMARHFVADDPPENLVAALTRTYLDSNGHLGRMAQALISHEAAWDPVPRKVLLPQDWGIALATLMEVDDPDVCGLVVAAAVQLGQRPYAAPSPKGWPDDRGSWLSAESVIARASWAQRIVETTGRAADPEAALAAYHLAADQDQVRPILGAASAVDAVALVAASPRFNLR